VATETSVDILTGWDTLAHLREEWNPLLSRSAGDSLFLTWEWIDAWREGVEDSVQPFVLTARDADGTLLGIAPLYRTRMRLLGTIPFWALRILGDYQSGGEYGDWILEPGREAEVGVALARALAATRDRWDCLWMPNVAGRTGARSRIVTASGLGGLQVRERPMEFSAIELPRDYREYWRALSGNSRSAIQRQAKKLQASGVSVVRCESPADLPSFIDALVDLNHRRWTAAGHTGTFKRKPLELAFYRRFTPVALARDWLRLFALKRAEEYVAVQIGYSYKGSFYQLQEGFDPAGPGGQGNVLRARVIEVCIDEGLSTYDFLGEHTAHKHHWLARVRLGYDLFVTHKAPRSAGLRVLCVWPTGRYLRPESLSSARSSTLALAVSPASSPARRPGAGDSGR
jgi:CelD/BcsL family acetyltransferase involved in cellulose biosynthesis